MTGPGATVIPGRAPPGRRPHRPLRVLVSVTHLLGAGHLTRAAALARAFAARGHRVTLLSGGVPARRAPDPGVELVQLPPVRVEGTRFSALLEPDGRPVEAATLAARRLLQRETLHARRPDVVVTELFPFGRRALAAEFEALLEEAGRLRPRPLVAASVRDILVAPAKAERVAEAHRRLARHYDLALVHGDPDLVALDASWPVDEGIRPLLRYTGYVDEGGAPGPAPGRRGIVVSGGSSAAALPLYRAALEAAAALPEEPWRVLVGRGIPEETFAALVAAAPAQAAVERARDDFRTLLAGAAVSVSQAGYNTAVDLLRTGPAAILVPFEADRETEQRLRAERLAAIGLATVIPEAELDAESLLRALRPLLRPAGGPRPRPPAVDLGGAERSVAIVEDAVRGAPAPVRRIDWSPVREALDRARQGGREIRFWWRDDDAAAATPALERLLGLADAHGAPLALAVIPARLDAGLPPVLAGRPRTRALVHGLSHRNHAPPEAKKAEFGAHRPLDALAQDAAAALAEAAGRLGPALLRVFVPPWNRIAPDLVRLLPACGYRGLSTFGFRDAAFAAPGLRQVNTHIDPIDWHGGRSLREVSRLIAAIAGAITRRAAAPEPGEAVGFLTHHLVHDEAIWAFCEGFLEELARLSASFDLAEDLF